MNDKLLLSREEAAEVLSIGVRSLDRLDAARKVPSVRVGSRRLYRPEDLVAWVAAEAARQNPPKPAPSNVHKLPSTPPKRGVHSFDAHGREVVRSMR